MEKEVYLVLSQTSSFFSQCIKIVTGGQYNHISLSLSPDLEPMFSFGRRYAYYPFWGGFVKESIHAGTFHRFPKTQCKVGSLSVTEEQFLKLKLVLEEMHRNKFNYGYDFFGLFLAAFGFYRSNENRFYCSEFIKSLFLDVGIIKESDLPKIAHPCDFLSLPELKIRYSGLLSRYPESVLPQN